MTRYQNILHDLDCNHTAMNREVSVYSEAAQAIRQLLADVGGGDTAITALEQEVAHWIQEVAMNAQRLRCLIATCEQVAADVECAETSNYGIPQQLRDAIEQAKEGAE